MTQNISGHRAGGTGRDRHRAFLSTGFLLAFLANTWTPETCAVTLFKKGVPDIWGFCRNNVHCCHARVSHGRLRQEASMAVQTPSSVAYRAVQLSLLQLLK